MASLRYPLDSHLRVLGAVSEQEIDRQLQFFEEYGIGVADREFAAYFVYRLRKGDRVCTRLNMKGACSFGSKCNYVHKCLYCGAKDGDG